MDLSAPTPFDLVILDRATANCFVRSNGSNSGKKHQIFELSTGSSTEHFSSSSSNGSYGTSPPPLGPSMSRDMSRDLRAQSVAKMTHSGHHQSTIIKQSLVKSASEMSVKQLEKRNSNSDSDFWLRVVPSCKIRPRNCDEVPEEFKRAGIGLCFGGKS